MGHPKRHDEPGAWHHLMNRGIGHRTMFDTDQDARGFLALVARAAHEGLLCPVAFCLLPTHFHLLAWSPEGRIAKAMQHLEGVYGRGFNRLRGRDGGLVRARYRSKLVQSDTYRRALVGYIDQNPVDAKLVVDPRDYPHGSARLYARASGPAWLSRDWLEKFACQYSGLPVFCAEAYDRTFGGSGRATRSQWIRSVLDGGGADDASLDALILATPEHVRGWMDARAMLADGARRTTPVTDAESVTAAIAEASAAEPDWTIRPRGRRRPAWTILAVGLLQDVAGLTLRQIGVRLSMSASVASDLSAEHRRILREDDAYASAAASLVRSAIDRCHGPRR